MFSVSSSVAPIPVIGLIFPAAPCKKSAVAPVAYSMSWRAGPGKSGESLRHFGPIVTV